MGTFHRKEVCRVIGSILSGIGLILIIVVVIVAVVIGLVVRAFRRRPDRHL